MLRLVNVPEKERIVSLRGLALLLGCLLVLLSPPATAQVSDGMRDGEEYAPVVLDGVELFRVRGMIVAPAEERAEDIVARIEAEAADPAVQPSAITARELDFGTGIFSGERLMFRIVDADAELEQVSRGWLAEMITERVRTAIIQYRAERGSTHLLRGLGLALAATLAMGVLTLLVQGSCRRLQRLITSKSDALHGIVEQRSFHVLTPKSLLALLLGLVGFVRWIILALALYAYLAFTLVLFPWTRRLADDALELFVDPIHTVGLAILGYLPKFVFLVIIILIARFVLRGARLFFQAIETRRITLGGFDHDWAMPTFRIVRVGIIVFTIVMAYPYVPGAGSAAPAVMSSGAGPRCGCMSCLATRRHTLPRPSSRPGTTTSLGRPCCGNCRSAVAIAWGSRPLSASSISLRPILRAARARMSCSSRGRVRGTMIALLSKDRISQNVL